MNSNRFASRSASLILQACCVSLLSGQALAQQSPTAGTILESVRAAPAEPRPDAQVIENKPAAEAPAPVPTGATRFHVNGYRFIGNTVFGEPVLFALLREHVGTDVTLDGLNEIAETIKAYYRDHHYFLAQAYIPPQRIADGRVEIRILEGRLGKADIKMDEKTRLKPSVARNYLSAMMPAGSIVTETGIEKPLLLINDLPGVIVHSTLKPGVEMGSADMDVVIGDVGRRFDGSVQGDNMGNRNSGRNRLGATVNASNLTGMGDLFTLRGLMSDKFETTLGQLSYTMPVGPYGTKLTGCYYDLTYKLGGAFAAEQADGDARVYVVNVQHPVHRSRNYNLFAQAGIEDKTLTDKLYDGANVEKQKVNDVYLGLNGDARDGLFGGALNTFSTTFYTGRLKIPEGVSNDTYSTLGDFSKVVFGFNRLQNLVSNTSLLLSARGQAAARNLTSEEKMSLGGPDGVRGHPVGDSPGDNVFLGTLELRLVIPGVKPLGGVLQFSAFHDFGYSRLNNDPLPTDTGNIRVLKSLGVGVNLGRRDDFQFKLELAFRKGEHSLDNDGASRVWAQVTKWF